MLDVPAQDGTVMSPQEVFGTVSPPNLANFNFSKSDFLVQATGGAAPAFGTTSSGYVGSVNDTLYPWPNQSGHWVPMAYGGDGTVPFDTHAVRLGHAALTIALVQRLPSGGTRWGSLPFDVALDPSVALVPIQVIVPYTKNHPQLGRRLAFQHMLWDLESTLASNAVINVTTPSGSELSTVHRGWANWRNREGDGHYRVPDIDTTSNPPTVSSGGAVFAPDSVFDRCGIQFRLVKYAEYEAPDDTYVAPTNDVCAIGGSNEPFLRAAGEADARGLTLAGITRVVFMEKCNCPDAQGQGGLDADGRFGSNTVCVGHGAGPMVLSHELGHAVGLPCEAYSTSAPGQCTVAPLGVGCAAGYSLMCEVAGDPTPTECSKLHAAAALLSNSAGW